MPDWRSKRSLRRTQGSRVLRGSRDLEQEHDADLRESPVKARRMKSSASIETQDTECTPRASTRDCAPVPNEYTELVDQIRQDVDFDHDEPPQRQHKDSVAGVELPSTFSRPFEKSAEGSTQDRRLASGDSAASINSTTSTTSVIRFSPTFPDRHKESCICTTCRIIRHNRRKASLKLYQKLESCRCIVMTIRSPADPANFERGKAWGHWLKLAGLYCKYETLPDIPVTNFEEENMLFERFMGAFSALVKALEYEKGLWWHLFNGNVEFGVATMHEHTFAKEVLIHGDQYHDCE